MAWDMKHDYIVIVNKDTTVHGHLYSTLIHEQCGSGGYLDDEWRVLQNTGEPFAVL